MQCDARYENIIRNLLGRTVIAETLGDAVRMSKKYDSAFRIVSLDGQVMNAGGSMTGGSSARGTGVLSRANELERLKKQSEKLKQDMEANRSALADAERDYNAVKYELEVARAEQSQAAESLHRYVHPGQTQTAGRDRRVYRALDKEHALLDLGGDDSDSLGSLRGSLRELSEIIRNARDLPLDE